jgi:hypothetical protein
MTRGLSSTRRYIAPALLAGWGLTPALYFEFPGFACAVLNLSIKKPKMRKIHGSKPSVENNKEANNG